MQKKESVRREERDTAKEARNASRAFRRAEREEEVSEDEESPYDLNIASDCSVNIIVPLMHTPPLHASDHTTILSQPREALPSDNKLLTFRSPAHGNSIVHMYPIQCVLNNSTPNIGAVLDTGAQRSAAKHPEEILRHTNSSHTMQGAFGKPTTMKGILLGCWRKALKGLEVSRNREVGKN